MYKIQNEFRFTENCSSSQNSGAKWKENHLTGSYGISEKKWHTFNNKEAKWFLQLRFVIAKGLSATFKYMRIYCWIYEEQSCRPDSK